ncbi:MAG: polyhydroxyalkanoate synthesis repressor PhaR [Aestuariivirgaceae bacterium]|nr:polyhydroxyalkanoate synthesis repressor PhaR [Aestuariivirgaceae bacterium]
MNANANETEKTAAIVIKKYANRRLYNTATSTYVTLDDLSSMVKQGTDFVVFDAKTGEDITRSVLTQIIFEEENKGEQQNLLPIPFLRQLIRFYGDQMQAFVPGYLEMSIDQLTRDQEKLREQFLGVIGVPAEPFKAMEEQTRRNMALFQEAMKVFVPFTGMPGMPNGASTPAAGPAKAEAAEPLQSLQEQLKEMQRQIDRLAGKPD